MYLPLHCPAVVRYHQDMTSQVGSNFTYLLDFFHELFGLVGQEPRETQMQSSGRYPTCKYLTWIRTLD